MASSGEAATSPLITVQVRTLSTGNHDVRVPATATVRDVKQQLVRRTGLPVQRQRMIYSGRVLEDGQTLESAGIADGHTLHLVEQDPAHQPAGAAPGGAAMPGWGAGQPDMLSALLGAGGPLGPAPQQGTIEAHVLGPFEVGGPNDATGWQQVQQQIQMQIAAAMSGMGAGGAAAGGAGAAPGVAASAAGGAAGAAAPGGPAPFNLASMFGPPGGAAGRGAGGAGGRGAGTQQRAGQRAHGWPLMADWPGAAQLAGDGGTHLLDGLELLLEQMEEEAQQAQQAQQVPGEVEADALPGINHVPADLEGVPPASAPAWRRQLSDWQHNFLHAAQAVLETAQLSAAARAATNRVLAAGGVETVPVTGDEGATEVERRIRSFPVLEHLDELSDVESPPAQPALAAGGGSPAAARRAGQRLGQQRIQELSQRQQRQPQRTPQRAQRPQRQAATAAAATAVQAAAAGEQDGAVEDYHSDEDGQQQGAGPASSASQNDDLPPLEVDWDSEEEEPQAAQRAQHAQRPQLPHADMLLLAAVCVGDLACRFLRSIGAGREGSPQAANLAAAERLRGLTEVPLEEGAARSAVVADVRLLVRQLSRLAAASAELMRAMQYVGSGIQERNAYFAGAPPGYIRTLAPGFDAVPALPRPMPRHASVGVPTAVDIAVVQSGPATPGQPGQPAGGWQQMLAGLLGGMAGGAGMPGGAPAGAAGAPAGGATGAAAGAAAGQQPAVRLRVGPPGQAVPVAIPLYSVRGAATQPGAPGQQQQQQQQQGAAAVAGAAPNAAQQAQQAQQAMSPELSNMARLLMAQLGVGPAEQQQMLGQFGGMMAALRSSSVTSLNVPQIAREVGTAVQRVVQEQSSGLRGALSARSSRTLAHPAGEQPAEGASPGSDALAAEAGALAARLGPAITGEVQRVLQAHLGRVRHDPLVEAFAPYLEQIGIGLGEEEAATEQQQGPQQDAAPAAATSGPQAAPAAAPATTVDSTRPAAAPAAASVQAALGVEPASTAEASGRRQPAAQPPAAEAASAASTPAAEAAGPSRPAGPPSSSGSKPAPAGLGRGFLLPRKPAAKKTAPASAAGEPSTSAAAAAAAPAGASEATAQQPAETATQPAPAAAGAAAAPASAAAAAAEPEPEPAAGLGAAPSAGALTTAGSRASARGGLDLSALLGAALGGGGSGTGPAPGRAASRAAPGALEAPGAAAGGGGGLMGMLQGMMSNPAILEMAQSPAMQRMAEQMFAGGSSGGAAGGAAGGGGAGGGSLAGMINAMAPMMGELLGGSGSGSAAGARGRSTRQLPANVPLEEALVRAGLSAEDAARWKATLEADDAAQAAAPPQPPLSDAYLAALPPRAAAGLLLRDDGEEEWSEGEEEASHDAAAAAQ